MTCEPNQTLLSQKAYKACIYTLTGLAVLYTAYLAQNIVLLLLVVGLVSLLLSPGMRVLERMHVPRVIGATLLLCATVLPAGIFATQLPEPLSRWAQSLPQLSTHVSNQIEAINKAIETNTTAVQAKSAEQEPTSSWFGWFKRSQEVEAPIESEDVGEIRTRIKESLFTVASDFIVFAPLVAIQFLTAMVLILFTLVYAPAIFRHYVTLFISEEKRKHVHGLALGLQKQLSRYILSVSIVNFCLGFCAFIVLYFLGLEDALLIGVVIGLLNFIPYVGPLIALLFISAGAYVQWGIDINVLICIGAVLMLNVLESQFVTPMVLAQQMRINPFIIILWLLFCGWMWGLVGVLIAVPLVVCIKLMLSQFESAKKWVELMAT